MMIGNWNPVLNKVVEILEKFGELYPIYNAQFPKKLDTETWIEYYARCIKECTGNADYVDLLTPLQIIEDEDNGLILLRYGNYSDIYGGEYDVTPEEFWNLADGFYRECRSVVIDAFEQKIVLCPFRKFFNVNELEETSIENIQERINKAITVEFSDKLDGSMCAARWYNERLILAGSQSLKPENSWRLEDQYRMFTSQQNYIQFAKDMKDYTLIFEYISQKDAHVVNYTRDQEGLWMR